MNEHFLGSRSSLPINQLTPLDGPVRNPESTLFNTRHNQSGSGLNILHMNMNHSMSLDRNVIPKNNSVSALQPIDFSLGQGQPRGNQSLNGLRGHIEEQQSESAVKACRICLEEEEDLKLGNPFITPCKCTGSMGYIHLKCLRDWTDAKKQA